MKRPVTGDVISVDGLCSTEKKRFSRRGHRLNRNPVVCDPLTESDRHEAHSADLPRRAPSCGRDDARAQEAINPAWRPDERRASGLEASWVAQRLRAFCHALMSFPRDHCGSSADVRSLMFGTARPATVTVVAADSTSPCNPGPCQIHPPDTRALISQCCAMPSNPLSPSQR